MDKKQAQAIVENTFENPFDKNRFIKFIRNLLNSIEESSFSYKGNLIPDAYEQYISLLERIGKYTDGEHRIDILVVKLKKKTSIERARTMQRNFIARYLNGSRGGELKDAALVAFVSPNNEDWRFSLVKMDYRFEDGKDGKVKVKEEFTPARRWSFLVGANEKSHTAKRQLVPIIADDKHNPTLAQLEEAFNIEKATKEFFVKYRDIFLWTKEELDKIVRADQKVKTNFDKQKVNTVDFAKKLLGQIVFLYFLQKKGWFGVERDKAWGTGSKRFLRDLFDGSIIEYKNFFNDVLEPLFYDALARDRSDVDHFNPLFKCKIPFLNGGLFDPIKDYDWAYTDILLPNDLFSNTIKTKEGDIGNGILDVFDRFNFTVKEDEPLEREVAIDPELLGKAYEKFNAIRLDNYEQYKNALESRQKGAENKFNRQYGVYYTPREIVHYMCQQSLINYLVTELEGKARKEPIEFLILKGEEYVEYLKTAKEKKEEGKKSKRYRENEYFIEIKKYARGIDHSLSNIKVCDPAIGSGAFPVGMMTEIIKARLFLSETKCLSDFYRNIQGDEVKRNAYNYKRECIEKSLYGVDIDPGAVEIAKLRLWLSLVVDEEDIEQIKPLPNLDYKVMQGNSLVEKYEGIKLIDEKFFIKGATREELLAEMGEEKRELERELINLYNQNRLTSARKNQIETRIGRLAARIQDYRDQDVIPAENLSLFGIDLVRRKAEKLLELQSKFFATFQKTAKDKLKDEIENLTWELIEATLRKQGKEDKISEILEFRKTNSRPFFLWKLHFAEVFHENNGFDVVIGNPPYVSNKDLPKDDKTTYEKNFSVAKGQYDLFNLFIERSIFLLGPNGVHSFIIPDSFLGRSSFKTCRLLFLNNLNCSTILHFNKVFEETVVSSVVYVGYKSKKSTSNKVKYVKSETVVDWINDKVSIVTFDQDQVKNNIDAKILHLTVSQQRLVNKIFSNKQSLENIAEFWRGEEIGKKADFLSGKPIKGCLKIISGNSIGRYVINGVFKYIPKSQVLKPLEKYKKEKICIRQLGDSINAVLDCQGLITTQSVYNIISEKNLSLKYLITVINSKLIDFLYQSIFREKIEFPRILIENLKLLPIVDIGLDRQRRFSTLVDHILAITKDEGYLLNSSKQAEVKEYERQIDQMVYKLYGLTPEEIAIVEQKTGAASS